MDTAMTQMVRAAVSEQDLTVYPIERSETAPSAWYTRPAFDNHGGQQIKGMSYGV